MSVHHFNNAAKVLRLIDKIQFISIDDEDRAVLIGFDPLIVTLIQLFEIIKTHVAFIIPATRLNMRHEGGDGSFEINQQIRLADRAHHNFKKCEVVLKITGGHQPHFVKIRCEYIGIFINSPVLYRWTVTGLNFDDLLKPGIQKVYLQVEGPTLHVKIKIVEIRIGRSVFIMNIPAIMSAQCAGQACLARADISSNTDMPEWVSA